jgi:tetratricopeptide (TPR) repeat protein
MTPTPEKLPAPGQPPLHELMARFLGRQSAAVGAGLAAVLPGDVEPHEAVPVQAVDPKHAWDGATAVLGHFGEPAKSVKAPADWSALVAAQPSHTGLAFAAGNFPQMVRDLAPLYRSAETLGDLPMADGPPVPVEVGPVSSEFPKVLLKLGTLRLARQWDAAEALMTECADRVPATWAAAWANEAAAVLWHRGAKAEAAKRWQGLPESVPVLFNRGMAALFTGRPNEARADLRRAVEKLPESSGWHHLGRLYLALAGG